MKPSRVLVLTLLPQLLTHLPTAHWCVSVAVRNLKQTKHDCSQGFVAVYCSECNDCPESGVIVGNPACCDLYLSNLPPLEGQSWLVIVWNGTRLVFLKCQGQSHQPTRSPSHLPTSLSHRHSTAMIANTHHPMVMAVVVVVVWPGNRDVTGCDVMTGRRSPVGNTWHSLC